MKIKVVLLLTGLLELGESSVCAFFAHVGRITFSDSPQMVRPPTKRMLGGSLGRPTNSFWSALPPFPGLWTAHQLPTCLLSMKSNSLPDPFPVCRYHGNNISPAAGTASYNPLLFLFSAEDGLWKPADLCPQRIHLFVCPFPTLPFFRSPFFSFYYTKKPRRWRGF